MKFRCHIRKFARFALLLGAMTYARADPAQDAYAAKLAGDYPRAIALYQQLVQAEPTKPTHFFQLGTVLGWSGRYAEARSVLERGLALAPSDPDLRLALARIDAWSGQLGRAESAIREILKANPNNLEAANMLGRVLLWQRQFDAAEETFNRILAKKSDDTDALIGAGDVQKFQERYDDARPLYERALRLDPGSRDVQDRLKSVKQAGRWRLDAGWEHSTYSGHSGRSDWQGWDANLRYAADKKTGLSLGTTWARRFNMSNQQYSAGVDRRFTDRANGYARATLTPGADFFARRSLAVGGDWTARKATDELGPTVLLADVRASTYGLGTALGYSVGVTQYTKHRFAGTAKVGFSRNLNGHWTNGWQVRLDGDPSETWRWNLGYADSRESLSATIYDYIRELRNQAIFGGLFHEFSPTWGLRVDLSHEWSPGAPARNTLHAGFTTRF